MKWDVVFTYTRKQAIEDGVLVDVSPVAREAGIVYPVALTCAVWGKYVEVPSGVVAQDEKGRLWDILWMLRHAAQRGGSEIEVMLYVQNDNKKPRRVTLKALCGPGDDLEPVITVMLPEED